MKKIIRIIAIILLSAFVIIQFFRPDFTNPSVNPADTIEASTQIPDDVVAIFKASCKDCHSHETVYPWYSYVQPSAWFLASHIADGRRKLNFSIWNTYEARKKRKKLDEICGEVKEAAMPLPSYLWIHRDASLNGEQIKSLCDWAEVEKGKIVD
jgi:hypothetical protein